ncbi:Peptidoglycan-binding lysin domain protein [Bacteroides coprosuis DSM 18011]|uniref:Peptidoglycan-binding lysin domain protein n=1 Tax=Bacteroides coprosuis DSM 18011 TaxID=679937 RepID=F3ZUL0_9BACE|nr:LysM peptidoglycan-binding domain-containing protein [Bacteroides coprosuis]EGJ71175.1 Peptidoglycan-binding lysin domain protein [Bacteroides coprosuis DSM 18011]HJD91892.1 LysM peptidoglycan-binding domain-containing protein [Bacteroides coprosuis]
MNRIKRIFLIFTLLSCSVLSGFAQDATDFFLHTIQKGENLYSIASMYKVSKEDIIKLNPGSDRVIYTGKALKIPQKTVQKKDDIFYTIKPGDTLYRLSVDYKVSTQAIMRANPGLSAQNFRSGQVIRIPKTSEQDVQQEIVKRQQEDDLIQSDIRPAVKPRCKEMHKVKRRETIFSVSRKYGITEQELINANPELKDGMKKGMFVCIPYPKETSQKEDIAEIIENPFVVDNPPTDSEVFKELEEEVSYKALSTIKTAIILPFLPENGHRGESMRMIEFYEGFLLAVDSLKRSGVSVDMYVYDSGKTEYSINTILSKPELKEMNVIVGPLYQVQIKPLAEFTQKNNIRLVIPFSAKTDVVFNNPSIYQINTPQSYLYSEVYQNFARKFANPNVIFVNAQQYDNGKEEFIKGFKQDLDTRSIAYKHVAVTDSVGSLATKLNPQKANIFVPTSGKDVTLIELIPKLTQLVERYPELNISMFGYPEWQTYTRDHIDNYFKLDTYFYSSFYTNNLLPAAKSFTRSYHKWYSKEMIDTYPRYGMLGFDIGYFFIKGLSIYGTALETRLKDLHLDPIQTGFNFNRVNTWGGFVNKKVFFVHFNRNYELVKIDFD